MREFPRFILASRSPRRCELLRDAGYQFDVVVPTLHEPPVTADTATPTQLAEALAYFKAKAVQGQHPDRLILAADTLVAHGRRLYGKADDEAQARQILSALSGTRHEVITGVCILLPPPAATSQCPEWRLLASDVTYVTMRPLSQAQIDAYIDSGEWRDKAGAYAIQETGDAFVQKLEGSLSNVVGLPMELVERMFDRLRPHLLARKP
jgi:septum formation protein